MEVTNKYIPEADFMKEREEVLATWPTGKDVDLDDAVDYLSKIPAELNFAKKMQWAKEQGLTLAQPRAGVPGLKQMRDLLKTLQDEGGADFLPSTIDAYTRQNRYEEAEHGMQESEKAGRALMNGFPAVNQGVANCRWLREQLNLPLQMRHGTPDSRLLAEIGHAGGYTSNEGGAISYNVPYAKSVAIDKSIHDWQYCDRLVGYYAEHGVILNREPFGPLTGTLVPPSISNAIGIMEMLLAAEQGVKNITIGYGQCGNIVQDVAAVRAMMEQAQGYLDEFGYKDVVLTSVFHEWMGGFPADEAKAFGLISLGATAAALAGAQKVIVKTPHEAVGIPTAEANCQGIKATKMVLNLLTEQTMVDSKALSDEMEIIKAETKCIMDKTFELGNGDLAKGMVEGFEKGTIDVPFAPSDYNAGEMLPARDVDGNIRYLRVGNLPFSQDLIDFNRAKMEERAKAQNRPVDFAMAVDDVFAVSKGRLVGSPDLH